MPYRLFAQCSTDNLHQQVIQVSMQTPTLRLLVSMELEVTQGASRKGTMQAAGGSTANLSQSGSSMDACAKTCLCQDSSVPTQACANTCLCQHMLVPIHACSNTCLCQYALVPIHACANTRLRGHMTTLSAALAWSLCWLGDSTESIGTGLGEGYTACTIPRSRMRLRSAVSIHACMGHTHTEIHHS